MLQNMLILFAIIGRFEYRCSQHDNAQSTFVLKIVKKKIMIL